MNSATRNSQKDYCILSRLLAFLLPVFLFAGCQHDETLFTLEPPEKSGIHFQNSLPENDTSFNILDYIYYYNGGGVATADINNDGLIDIFFTSNKGDSKLYLNKGGFRFEDITARAGVAGMSNWKTGVTMADVNGDGWMDIYVCAVGNFKQLTGRNELYINNKDGTFTESAKLYGLDITAFSTQASFFDYDKDGDLDMFLVCHAVHSTETFQAASVRSVASAQSGDKLFMNQQKDGKNFFTEVTKDAGIYNSALGYGLNVVVGDFNNDNWDDIYVSNDFHENDYYYLNNKNGTFRESNASAFGHESRFSMGSDAADLNNDGALDIISMDMLASDEKVLKSSVGEDPYDVYNFKMGYGYHTQYARNCLQLNRGDGEHFSEIGLYAGIAATDWSWSPLAADFDNDGIKDLFVTNGIVKRPNDLDYLKYANQSTVFNLLQKGKTADIHAINQMPSGKTPNYFFKGSPDLKFQDKSAKFGFGEPTLSNGAAYADLDNDGDLDIVINNINSPAMVYRNHSQDKHRWHFLDIELRGAGRNPFAMGAKVVVTRNGQMQMNYLTGSRGFLSASTNILHFGLGENPAAVSVDIVWPSGKGQHFAAVTADQRLIVNETAAPAVSPVGQLQKADEPGVGVFTDITARSAIHWRHHEDSFNDFNVQPLIPHMVSTAGPKLAVADINKDGLDDFFVSGARNQPGAIFIQQANGTFKQNEGIALKEDSLSEDTNALFFDANGDGYPDLYIVSGGNENEGASSNLQDRLYINDKKAGFIKSSGLPVFYGNKSVAAAADIDHDGDMDLFVGGRVVAGSYGLPPASWLLLNDGKGNFTIAPDSIAPGLQHIGMVTDAVWTDKDQDGWADLVLVGEWMPVTFFSNNKGRLVNHTAEEGLANTTGLWQRVEAIDTDDNGYPDLVLGNWGENSKLDARDFMPLVLYVGDMDNNGTTDQILAIPKNGQYYPFLNKEDLEKQLPFIRKKFELYGAMAGLTVEEIFGEQLERMKKLTVHTTSSCLFMNDGHYAIKKLPVPLQWTPVFGLAIQDFNNDGKKDILAAGNFFGVNPYEGRYDAGFGLALIQAANGYTVLPAMQAGLNIKGESRDIKTLQTANKKKLLLVARNNDYLQLLKWEN